MNILTLGTFDIFHVGHLRLFKFCKELAGEDIFIVGLNTDGFVNQFKGHKPVMNYREREEMIKELGIVDRIIPNNQKCGSAVEVVMASGADLIVVGSDWARKDYMGQLGITWDWLDENEIGVCYYPRHIDMSSTKVKEKVRA